MNSIWNLSQEKTNCSTDGTIVEVPVLAVARVVQEEMWEIPLVSWMRGAIVYSNSHFFSISVWMKKGYIL